MAITLLRIFTSLFVLPTSLAFYTHLVFKWFKDVSAKKKGKEGCLEQFSISKFKLP